jgi:hypothetical protein
MGWRRVIPLACLALLLQGCPLGEAPKPYGAIEVLVSDQTPEEMSEAIKILAFSLGFERSPRRTIDGHIFWPEFEKTCAMGADACSRAFNEKARWQIGDDEQVGGEVRFELRNDKVYISVVIERALARTDAVLKFTGGWDQDFEEVAEPEYSRLTDLLVEKYGERNVRTGEAFYCCGLRERHTYQERHFR